MRRPVLVAVAVLGLVIVLIGGTGLFAALTDVARTGTNTVDSAGLAASADIRLATATREYPGPITCGTYAEDLTSGFFSVADVEPGYASPPVYFCIKNVGSQSVVLWPSADELTDIDTACTGDEDLAGDTTCGGGAAGELSSVLFVDYTRWSDCSAGSGGGFSQRLRDNALADHALTGTLAAGAEACMSVRILYGSSETPTNVQQAQSDRVTWRFKFRADAV